MRSIEEPQRILQSLPRFNTSYSNTYPFITTSHTIIFYINFKYIHVNLKTYHNIPLLQYTLLFQQSTLHHMVKHSADKIQTLLKKHKGFSQTETGKIHCDLTNHEMATPKQFKEYLKGKAYKRALEANFELKNYSQHLDPYHNNDRFLFCKITGAKVVNKKSAIEKHVQGKKYKKTLERVTQELLKNQEKEEKKLAEKAERKAKGGRKHPEAEKQDEQQYQNEAEEEEEQKEPEPKVSKKGVEKKGKKISKVNIKPKRSVTKA